MRRIAGIVLAAGGSTRFGEPKQLLELNGESLVHAAVRAAKEGGCDTVCVVTGHAQAAVQLAVSDLGPILAPNKEWQRGMGSSIRLGIAAVQPVSAVVLLTCDQPAVDAKVIRSLIERHDQTGGAIVATQYSGTLGVPALFAASCFSDLQKLPDHRGAKTVIEADPARVTALEFPFGATDLDSPEDLRAWLALSEAPHGFNVEARVDSRRWSMPKAGAIFDALRGLQIPSTTAILRQLLGLNWRRRDWIQETP